MAQLVVFFGSVCELRSLCFVSSKFMHYAAFHQRLHCLPRQNRSSEKNNIFFEIITYEPSIYTIDHPDSTVSSFMENSIGLTLKRVNPSSAWGCCSFLEKDSIVEKNHRNNWDGVPTKFLIFQLPIALEYPVPLTMG